MGSSFILDEDLFDETFIPERLVCREGQIREIAKCLEPVRNGKSGRNLFIHGPPGTGKTSVCKWMLKEHFPRSSVYVNCWSKRTTNKIMESILVQSGNFVHGRESTSDLIRMFEGMDKKVVVCLDESDHVKDPGLLYTLSRNSNTVVLISNEHSFAAYDDRIRSSLLLSEIEFKPYSVDEILAILRERTAYGFISDVIDDNLLSVVARACKGDARVALQTLKIAAQEAEARNIRRITIEEILTGVKSSRKYRLSYLLGKLNDHQRLIYQILKENGKMESGKLFEALLNRLGATVIDRTYRNHMERMEELGLVRAEGTGRWKAYQLSA
jgi:Cdc6-like AAA superfamily ATPase